ncbi:hypothetical protein BU16DRAFT_347854 [Lophium mytilinum]|uniref:DUF3533 domain-containing protein n=1 Tax=Lophium mytilinum TaxID=390894 RepID=A0A6A6R0U6_9PEZI|nr:hypothetical protein BU16DRAFT_347854 [Lophium mytilinum]
MLDITFLKFWHIWDLPTINKRNRTPYKDDYWKGIRTKFFVQTAAGGVAMMVLFLVCCSYLYGTLYRSSFRHENMHVLAVQYDEGVISQALSTAYKELQGPTFPTIYFHSPDDYPTPEDIYASVRRGRFRGAVYTTENASSRLEAAFQGGLAASSYNTTKALSYVWNQEYYTTFAESVVQASLQELVVAVGVAYVKINGTQAFPYVARSDPAAIQAFLNPIQAAEGDIHPDPKGASVFFSTVSMAMPALQQFFFLLVLNGVCRQHQVYSKMTIRSSTIVRRFAGIIYTLGASLGQSGYYWAFRESWDVNGVQFVLTWMTLWLLMHIHLNILDAFAAVLPLPVMPFIILIWIFINIATTVSPLELQPGFYHWGICLPSHNSYLVLVTIWTGGANNRLYRALPILFSWWIVGNVVSTLAHVRACQMAFVLERFEEIRPQDLEAPSILSEEESETRFQRPATQKSEENDGLGREKTMEDRAMEQRKIYGPSIPPAF